MRSFGLLGDAALQRMSRRKFIVGASALVMGFAFDRPTRR